MIALTQIEDQRLQRQAKSAEEAAAKKVEKVKSDQQNQIDKLVQQQERMEAAATLVEVYAADIEKVCLVINSAVSTGMDWTAIEQMVRTEAAAGNPIAGLVHKLRLDRNHVVLRLKDLFADQDDDSEVEQEKYSDNDSDNSDDDDGDESPRHQMKSKSKAKAVKKEQVTKLPAFIEAEIDLSLSAYANARNMFGNKKVAHSKELKTIEVSAKVIQSVEQQALKSINSQKIVRNLRAVRKVHWFEKFHW